MNNCFNPVNNVWMHTCSCLINYWKKNNIVLKSLSSVKTKKILNIHMMESCTPLSNQKNLTILGKWILNSRNMQTMSIGMNI